VAEVLYLIEKPQKWEVEHMEMLLSEPTYPVLEWDVPA
jgi:hypothetical protein